jgi:hypothetical protein
MYRGAGPRGTKEGLQKSFDGFLQKLTIDKGATLINERVDRISYDSGKPHVTTKSGSSKTYDLIAGAVGVNTTALKFFNELGFGYQPPQVTKTYICEFFMGYEMIQHYLGDAMHAFLLKIPRLKFAALIPKDNTVTMCLIGKEIDRDMVKAFMNNPEVKKCFPDDFDLQREASCQCYPKINTHSCSVPFADRIVMIGDCAVSRLYKDGIGSAYIEAKAAAATAIFEGISAHDFKKGYWQACKAISSDNKFGALIYGFTSFIKNNDILKKSIIQTIIKEQPKDSRTRYLSTALWDTFSGSATYRNIFLLFLHPFLFGPLIKEIMSNILPRKKGKKIGEVFMDRHSIGRTYKDGETIITRGEPGDCMYVIQSGRVAVIQSNEGKEVRLAELGEGDVFGEMALFLREVRTTTVRAVGEVQVITVDKKTLLQRIQADPTLALNILENMSNHIRNLNQQHVQIMSNDRRDWGTRPDTWNDKK